RRRRRNRFASEDSSDQNHSFLSSAERRPDSVCTDLHAQADQSGRSDGRIQKLNHRQRDRLEHEHHDDYSDCSHALDHLQVLLEVNVQSHSGNDNGTAIAVVTWIGDVLKQRGKICATPDMKAVVTLDDFLAIIVKPPITEE